MGTLKYICSTGYDHTWFILNQTLAQKELALSGSEQNPDITGKSYLGVLSRLLWGSEPVRKFQQNGLDWTTASNLKDLVKGMNDIVERDGRGPTLNYEQVEGIVMARDAQMDHKYSKDSQVMMIHNAKSFGWDTRVTKPHKITDPKYGPLVAIRMNLITRKTLGGILTNLDSQVMDSKGEVIPGLYAAGEAAGFGGGGVMGKNALEGTFLGGCIFSGRNAGRALAAEGEALSAKTI